MKILLKVISAFFLFIIVASIVLPAYAAEEAAADHKNEPGKVLKYTDYNSLKGAELIKMVQMVLRDSGFDPGQIDGILGPKTRAAIKRFQIKNELEPTGDIDTQTLDRLFW